MEYLYAARFLRSLKKLPTEIQDDVVESVAVLKKNNKAKQLKLHKLHGGMSAYHAFSANFTYRVVIKITKEEIYFMDVGTHDVYK